MDSSSLLSMCSGASWDSSKSRLRKDNLPFYPGKMETRVVMYIRQGAEQHACFQTFETFALDTRRASNAFSEIAGKFGRFLIADTIGKGGAGVVYKVRALEGALDVEIGVLRQNC